MLFLELKKKSILINMYLVIHVKDLEQKAGHQPQHAKIAKELAKYEV